MEILTAIIAFSAAAQAFMSWRQNKRLKESVAVAQTATSAALRQAKVMKDALAISDRTAQAAEKSAEAAIRSTSQTRILERPWLLADIVLQDVTEAVDREALVAKVEIHLRNDGRGPAWITHHAGKLVVMDMPLPADPPYDDLHRLNRYPMPVRAESPFRMEMGQSLTPELREIFKHWWDDRKCLVAFGVVRYVDALDDEPHETCFCWTWYNRIDGRFGPPNWTRHT